MPRYRGLVEHPYLSGLAEDPAGYVGRVLALREQPRFFDILPMYILLLTAVPAILLTLEWLGSATVLLASGAAWAWAQLGPDPFPAASGHFDLAAWQLLFVLGLWLGWRGSRGEPWPGARATPALAAAAAAFCLAMFLARWGWVQLPLVAGTALGEGQRMLLVPIRLLDFLASAWLAAWACARWVPRQATVAWLALLGRRSLEVFSFHVLLCYSLGVSLWFWTALAPVPGPLASAALELLAVASLAAFALACEQTGRLGVHRHVVLAALSPRIARRAGSDG
jgi:hypothetical protein